MHGGAAPSEGKQGQSSFSLGSFMEEQGVPGPAVDPVVAEPQQLAVLARGPWGCATAVLKMICYKIG